MEEDLTFANNENLKLTNELSSLRNPTTSKTGELIHNQLSARFAIESRNRELEENNKKLGDSVQRYEIELKIMLQKFEELQRSYETSERQFSNFRKDKEDYIVKIEDKLSKQVEKISHLTEVSQTNKEEVDRLRFKLKESEDKQEMFREKYEKKKGKLAKLEGVFE